MADYFITSVGVQRGILLLSGVNSLMTVERYQTTYKIQATRHIHYAEQLASRHNLCMAYYNILPSIISMVDGHVGRNNYCLVPYEIFFYKNLVISPIKRTIVTLPFLDYCYQSHPALVVKNHEVTGRRIYSKSNC